MIISGGVNIYPQESENILINHDAVFDVGVIGLPDEDRRTPRRFRSPVDGVAATSDDLAAELIAYTKTQLASFKVPKEIRFVDDLPAHPRAS